jgi:hypothetical protein
VVSFFKAAIICSVEDMAVDSLESLFGRFGAVSSIDFTVEEVSRIEGCISTGLGGCSEVLLTVTFLRFEGFGGTQGMGAAFAPLRRVVTMAECTLQNLSVTSYQCPSRAHLLKSVGRFEPAVRA